MKDNGGKFGEILALFLFLLIPGAPPFSPVLSTPSGEDGSDSVLTGESGVSAYG